MSQAPQWSLQRLALGFLTGATYRDSASACWVDYRRRARTRGRPAGLSSAPASPDGEPALVPVEFFDQRFDALCDLVPLLGRVIGIAVIRVLYPDLSPDEAAEVMLPHRESGEHASAPTLPN